MHGELTRQHHLITALLESGVGAIHAINERIAGAFEARGRAAPGTAGRALIGAAIICGAGVFAMWREIVQTRARRP